MTRKVLITGGAGFIGSLLTRDLIKRGHPIRVLDNFNPRVHGPPNAPKGTGGVDRDAELVTGDVRDAAVVGRALAQVDTVIHLAAETDIGESLFESERCISVNHVGAAVLANAMRRSGVERVIVASTMSVYGEGAYEDRSGVVREVERRTSEQLLRGRWEPGGESLTPIGTPETKEPSGFTIYARSKLDQERVFAQFAKSTGVATTILRLFNVYGARQHPADPYAGQLSSFVTALLQGRRPLVPEDGGQLRDFVHVDDAVAAFRRALERPVAAGGIVNIGTGRARSVLHVAQHIARLTGRPDLVPELSGRGTVTDVRHCFANVNRARTRLGHVSRIDLDDGLLDLIRDAGRRDSRRWSCVFDGRAAGGLPA